MEMWTDKRAGLLALGATAVSFVALVILGLFIGVSINKLLWRVFVPRFFPRGVAMGAIPERLSWKQAISIGLLMFYWRTTIRDEQSKKLVESTKKLANSFYEMFAQKDTEEDRVPFFTEPFPTAKQVGRK